MYGDSLAFHHAEFFSYKKHWLAITKPIFKKMQNLKI